MAIFYKEGENKIRPGIYQRYSNAGRGDLIGAKDGVCAIPVQATWGPLGKVVKNVNIGDLTRNYGSGVYGEGYTVPAAAAMFEGGANTVYTYRMGNGGKQATLTLADGLTVTAKYPGTIKISVAVQEKLGDSTKKQFLVYVGNALVETWVFDANGTTEGANLIAAVKDSKYITVTGEAVTVAPVAVASGALSGGENPTVTNEDYSKAFAALEPYYYNTIAIDVDDDEDMSLSLLLQAYLDDAHELGKLGIAVVGQKTSVAFEKRLNNVAKFNDEKVVFLGGGWMKSEAQDGVLAICYTAGVIAACPSNKGITHYVINGATDLCESLKNSDYEAAISAGMLMVSRAADGSIWYESGVNTLTTLEEGIQDAGWKKIRRVKTRFEAFYRLDTALAPKAGRVSNDTDGIADCVQTGQRIIDAMVNEGKLYAGATFAEDPANPATGDSAWFIISMDDIDSLEKIYLHYRLRYSQNS